MGRDPGNRAQEGHCTYTRPSVSVTVVGLRQTSSSLPVRRREVSVPRQGPSESKSKFNSLGFLQKEKEKKPTHLSRMFIPGQEAESKGSGTSRSPLKLLFLNLRNGAHQASLSMLLLQTSLEGSQWGQGGTGSFFCV